MEDTQFQAWTEIQPTLGERCREICEAMWQIAKPVTARELRFWMWKNHYRYWEYTWTYMSKLERSGCVRRVGTKKCSVTQATATTWELVAVPQGVCDA